jgi:nicotinate-nucleotide adenylyltransferase
MTKIEIRNSKFGRPEHQVSNCEFLWQLLGHPITRSPDVPFLMNIAIFGGTFDPIHAGHLAAARFHLDRILFIPTGNPPHKIHDHLTDYAQRYAMVAVACANEPRFIPSTIEAPTADGSPRYSIDTVRTVRRRLRQHDRLFFLVGADAFLDLPHWKDFRRLLDSVEFIVVSRPGFDSDSLRQVAPPDLLPARRLAQKAETIRLRHGAIHLLHGVDAPVASRDIRQAVRARRSITDLVPELVEEYILKEGLYNPSAGRKRLPR